MKSVRDAIKSARRVFEVLEYFDRERRPLALGEIVTALAYPASSASVLLKSIVALGYLEYDRASRTYLPTMRIAALGRWVETTLFANGPITALMEHLHRTLGETVILGAASDLYAQYVHLIHSQEPLHFAVPPGTRRPLASSGMGWALLSTLADREIEKLRRRMNAEGVERPRLTAEELGQRIKLVRARGYSFSRGSISEGVGIIAMPIPAAPFGRRLAVGLGGPVPRLQRKEKAIVAELRAGIARFLL